MIALIRRPHPCLAFATLLAALIASPLLFGQDDDVLFRAMQDELARSVERLKLEDQGRPYFVEYRVNEHIGHRIQGSFGALTVSEPYHNRMLAADVRIGSYQFDNTGFFSRADFFNQLTQMSASLVIDDNYMALRRDLWLATDKSYKAAVEQMAAKRAYLESRVEKDTIPGFSSEPVTTLIDPRPDPAFNITVWEDRVRRWSAIFRRYPEIQESSVSFSPVISVFYLINSEGTRVRTWSQRGTISISLSTQAADGTTIGHSHSLRLTSFEADPTDAEIESIIQSLAHELTELRNATVLEKSYIGPVLLVDEAAGTLFERVLVPQLAGSRLPLVDDQSMTGMLGTESDLEKRMNLRVMPRFLSVYDDPTMESAYGRNLTGHYRVDHQGVPARRIPVIENGVARGLLTSRRPGREIRNSTGHGRGFSNPGPAIGNLLVKNSEEKSYDEMKAELIRYCRDLGLEYGVLIRRVGESSSSFSGGGLSVQFGSGEEDKEMTSAARVYVEDGREEPLRGFTLDQLNLRTLKDIVAAGGVYTVLNTSVRPNGVADFSSVPASIIAPSILLEEVQLNPSEAPGQKAALLTHPYFDK